MVIFFIVILLYFMANDKKTELLESQEKLKTTNNSIEQQKALENNQNSKIEENKLDDEAWVETSSTVAIEWLESWVHTSITQKELDALKPEVKNDRLSEWNQDRIWIWWKSKEFMRGQWDKFTGKEKEEGHIVKNTARVLSGLWVWFWVYRWIKKLVWLFWDKKENNDSTNSKEEDKKNVTVNIDNKQEKSRRQKAFPRLAVWTGAVGAWYFFRERLYKLPIVGPYLDKLFNKRLSINDALEVVNWNLQAKAKETHLKTWANLKYNEDTKILQAFGYDFKIDTEKNRIEWLDITFQNYEELISTAAVIWAAKNTFKGKCAKTDPFSISSWWGDIEATLSDTDTRDLASGSWKPVGAIWWAAFGSLLALWAWYLWGVKLWGYTAIGAIPGFAALWSATIDKNNTIAQIAPSLDEQSNKLALVAHLNTRNGWAAHKATQEELKEKAKTNSDTINETFVKTLSKIQNKKNENDESNTPQSGARNAEIKSYTDVNGKINNDIMELQSWDQKLYLKVEKDANGNINKVIVEDSWLEFTWPNAVSQALHLGLFVSKMCKECPWNAVDGDAFSYKRKVTTLRHPWIYYNDSKRTDVTTRDDNKLSKEAIKKDMPDLLEWDRIDKLIDRLNKMVNDSSESNLRVEWWTRKNTFLDSLNTSSKQTA